VGFIDFFVRTLSLPLLPIRRILRSNKRELSRIALLTALWFIGNGILA